MVAALVTTACGGGGAVSMASPTGVSAGGSSISGLVRGAALSPASVGHFSMLANSSITVTINGTNISSPVDGSGQFTLRNVPPGPVTLTFSGQGLNATVSFNVAADEDVKIAVTVNGSSARLDSEEHHAHEGDHGTEVSGPLSSLDSGARTFKVNTQLVHVPTSASIRREDKTITFADLKNGDDVEVRGTMSGTTFEATEVKVDNESAEPAENDEND